MNFYVSHLTDCKVPVQNTSIPRHLDVLLEILLGEEKEENETGPCLEYLLQHKLLDLLATLASAEAPPGMRMVCLAFLRKLLGRSKYPLLHHASIYSPVQRLIALCNGNPPSPIEAEEVPFIMKLISFCSFSPIGYSSSSSIHKIVKINEIRRFLTIDTLIRRCSFC